MKRYREASDKYYVYSARVYFDPWLVNDQVTERVSLKFGLRIFLDFPLRLHSFHH